MNRRTSLALAVLVILTGVFTGTVSADNTMLDLPPGIEQQAQPLLAAMMERMALSGMSPQQRDMMMHDMQTIVDQLPPGIFLRILELMPELTMPDMMFLHQELIQGDLLQQPPGQILLFVRDLAE
jgi:hypothetical protein